MKNIFWEKKHVQFFFEVIMLAHCISFAPYNVGTTLEICEGVC
jgi:hypothetical protein